LQVYARQPEKLNLSLNSIIFGPSAWQVDLAPADTERSFNLVAGEAISLVCRMRRKPKGSPKDEVGSPVLSSEVSCQALPSSCLNFLPSFPLSR
jgi:hypothetical protein